MSKGKVVVRHKVHDFATWKPYFTGDTERQREVSFTHLRLTRNKHDRDELVIIFDCEDLDKAKPMFSEPNLGGLMRKAGVLDQPAVFFLEEIEARDL